VNLACKRHDATRERAIDVAECARASNIGTAEVDLSQGRGVGAAIMIVNLDSESSRVIMT
jgi:hypothetical protein